jgi:glycosyltransferase involved in cell wall biosynthesis
MNIVYVYADATEECTHSEWRCAILARAINRTKRHSAKLLNLNEFGLNTQRADVDCSSADVIVVQCNLIGPVLSAIQHWKARDKVVIVDFDDAYDLMPSTNPSYQYWSKGIKSTRQLDGTTLREQIYPPPLTQFKWGLRLAHAATVPSLRLADDWREYTDVYYLPKFIDLEKYHNVKLEPHEGINIGWGGNKSHLQSFKRSGVVEALGRVCDSRPQVKVIIAGGDKRIFDLLPFPENRKTLLPWVSNSQWSQVLSKFDIGLAPLHGPFDDRRSWFKVLEYMVMKIPWVGSAGSAHFEIGDYGLLINNHPDVWERVLLDIIDNLHEYKLEASRLPYLFGISQSIDENVEKLIVTYQNVMNKVFGLSVDNLATPQ